MQCEILHLESSDAGVYFVAVQIEDFASSTDTTPLSSIPLQSMVIVTRSTLPCNRKPRFVSVTRLDGSCVGVPSNTSWNELVIVRSTSTDVR